MPAAHNEQVPKPAVTAYLPAAHNVQLDAPAAEYMPGGHKLMAVAPPAAATTPLIGPSLTQVTPPSLDWTTADSANANLLKSGEAAMPPQNPNPAPARLLQVTPLSVETYILP